MFKNDEIKKLTLIIIITTLLLTLLTILISKKIYNNYKTDIIENNAYIISDIIKKHPELTEEIILSITTSNKDTKNALLLEQKYGINEETIAYTKRSESMKKELFKTNIILYLTIAIIYILIIYIFLKKLYQRINKINNYTTHILNDDFSLDIREYEEGDISNLKNEIYKVTVKLKQQNDLVENDKKYLEETLSDISHQLKTPLTSMYVINDILKENPKKKDKEEFLEKNHLQLEKIEWLITSLLNISRLDSGTIKLKKENIYVSELIERSIESLNINLKQKNIKIDLKVQDYKLPIDLNWTSEALINIIKNASEHGAKNIIINTKTNPLYNEITIEDDGIGINKKDLPHIFKRFYKADTKKESIGIGLNLAKKLIDMQNGEITVTSKEKEGTTFTIKFYKNII